MINYNCFKFTKFGIASWDEEPLIDIDDRIISPNDQRVFLKAINYAYDLGRKHEKNVKEKINK